MSTSGHCTPSLCSSDLWITYQQASRTNKQQTTQLVRVSDDALNLFDLEDVLDYVFEQGFVDAKWRSVAWWEECTSARLKASHAIQELLARGAGTTPATALRLVIADIPAAIWVHYEYVHCSCPHTATQRIRLDAPQMKSRECMADITNYIFAQGYLPCKARSMVSWRASCGKHIAECAKVEDVLSWGEGVCEEKPLRLVIDI